MMKDWRIFLFGRFQIQVDEDPIPSFETRKVQELFCYMLLHRGRPHSREGLASLLWSDKPTPQARKYLRQALWQLQSCLENAGEHAFRRMLVVEDDWVTMSRDAALWLDVSLFEQSYQLCKGRPGRDLTPEMAQALQLAIQLYRGDLLEGWYQEWCLFERERYQAQYLAMLDKMLDYCEASCDYEGGLAYGESVLRCDRARERTHRRLMRLYWLLGDRTAALRQYDRCVSALAEDLDVKPSARTLALYQQIRADRPVLSQCNEVDGEPAIPEPASPALHDVLARLRQMHTLLASLQRQVQSDIRAVEQIILHQR